MLLLRHIFHFLIAFRLIIGLASFPFSFFFFFIIIDAMMLILFLLRHLRLLRYFSP